MQFVSFAVLGRRIKAIWPMLKDKSVPKRKKALVIFGMFYLVMPFDLIPLIIPVIGVMDDLVLWLYILITLREELDKYGVDGPLDDDVKKARKNYDGKTIIDGVDFEIWDGDKEKANSETVKHEGEKDGQGTV